MPAQICDVLIVGGGVMGCSTAYHLTRLDPGLRVLVCERDPTYEFASSTLSLGNVRIQFSLEENIQISQYASEVFETFEQDMAVADTQPSIGFRREGNLFLVAAESEAAARSALALQQSLGGEVQWWSPEQIGEHYPLYRTRGLVGGTFGRNDGHLDAHGVLMGYKAKARQQGASFHKDEVVTIEQGADRVQGVLLAGGQRIVAEHVINCAGPWAAQVAKTAGVSLPIEPVQRQVFVLDPAVKPARRLPLTVLPSGLYFRTEGHGLILLGKSLGEDPVGFEFRWDRNRFADVLWAELADIVPAFDTVKLLRGWTGLYSVNTLDKNAILGEWPDLTGLWLANGFSGHGFQQAPAVGRYLAELILSRPPSLDLSVFSPHRVLERKPLPEQGVV
jgi:glycine/D-amino acid oxidase-like deaminating enzyme